MGEGSLPPSRVSSTFGPPPSRVSRARTVDPPPASHDLDPILVRHHERSDVRS